VKLFRVCKPQFTSTLFPIIPVTSKGPILVQDLHVMPLSIPEFREIWCSEMCKEINETVCDRILVRFEKTLVRDMSAVIC
jgi:hypothetical protein